MTVQCMTRRMWHVWPGQHWPMLLEQEQVFVSELAEAAKGKEGRFDRDDVTALLTALRCGTTFDQLLEIAPGVRYSRVLGAYRCLERQRSACVDAWEAIEDAPTFAAMRRNSDTAAKLLPLAVHRIFSSYETMRADGVAEAVAEMSAEVHRVRVLAHGLEAELAACKPGSSEGIEIGSRLYNPISPGVYGHAFYLPDRISALTPIRVRELLGDRHAG